MQQTDHIMQKWSDLASIIELNQLQSETMMGFYVVKMGLKKDAQDISRGRNESLAAPGKKILVLGFHPDKA